MRSYLIEPDAKAFPEGTDIQTFANHSVFTWDRGRPRRTFIHPPSIVPSLQFNSGFGQLGRLHKALNNMDKNSLKKAFATAYLGSDSKILTFMNELKTVINGNDMSDDMLCYYHYHNLLNHVSLKDMHVLAKNSKLPSQLLNIKITPPCPSYLFGRAHRKLWRSKGKINHVK